MHYTATLLERPRFRSESTSRDVYDSHCGEAGVPMSGSVIPRYVDTTFARSSSPFI